MAKSYIGSYFFTVPITFFNQPKVRKLSRITEGIGAEVYLATKATIISTNEPIDALGIETMAEDLCLEESEVRNALEVCCNLGLLIIGADAMGEVTYTSPEIEAEIQERSEYLQSRRERGAAGGKKSAELRAVPMPKATTTQAHA